MTRRYVLYSASISYTKGKLLIYVFCFFPKDNNDKSQKSKFCYINKDLPIRPVYLHWGQEYTMAYEQRKSYGEKTHKLFVRR